MYPQSLYVTVLYIYIYNIVVHFCRNFTAPDNNSIIKTIILYVRVGGKLKTNSTCLLFENVPWKPAPGSMRNVRFSKHNITRAYLLDIIVVVRSRTGLR